jgi:hypothetical protein
MLLTKTKPYRLIKEDLHEEQNFLRQNRNVNMRFKLSYDYLKLYKALGRIHRPYHGFYKQIDKFKKLVKQVSVINK